MIVVSFGGFGYHPCGNRTVEKTISAEVPVGMQTVSATNWSEAKNLIMEEMERQRPLPECTDVCNEQAVGDKTETQKDS